MRLVRTHGDPLLAVVASGLLAFELAIEAASSQGTGPDAGLPDRRAAEALVWLALTASLAWRRPASIVVLGIGVAGLAIMGTGPQVAPDFWVYALLIGIYSVGAHATGRLALVGGLEVAAVLIAAIAQDPGAIQAPGDLMFLVLILGGPWLAGLGIRFRREREGLLERRTLVLERDQEQAAQAAVVEERARIARELHDVVAHALSVMVLQARGGRRAMRTDAESALEAFDTIETTGAEALSEMRRLVGVLRTDDEGLALAPQPSLRDFDALVGQVRDAGLSVDLSIEGTPIDLSPGVDLAAYRILQESLTNCLQHARAGMAKVVVRYGRDDIDIEVSDTGTAAAEGKGGHGLIGMRERVALYGGSIEIGPREGGGFAVRARLPMHPGRP